MAKEYYELEIWQDGIRFVKEVYKATKHFPDCERAGLAADIQRAAISIPSNIAEGYAQQSSFELNRHLRVAMGAAAEVDTELVIALQLQYLSAAQTRELREQLKSLVQRIRTFLIASVPA